MGEFKLTPRLEDALNQAAISLNSLEPKYPFSINTWSTRLERDISDCGLEKARLDMGFRYERLFNRAFKDTMHFLDGIGSTGYWSDAQIGVVRKLVDNALNLKLEPSSRYFKLMLNASLENLADHILDEDSKWKEADILAGSLNSKLIHDYYYAHLSGSDMLQTPQTHLYGLLGQRAMNEPKILAKLRSKKTVVEKLDKLVSDEIDLEYDRDEFKWTSDWEPLWASENDWPLMNAALLNLLIKYDSETNDLPRLLEQEIQIALDPEIGDICGAGFYMHLSNFQAKATKGNPLGWKKYKSITGKIEEAQEDLAVQVIRNDGVLYSNYIKGFATMHQQLLESKISIPEALNWAEQNVPIRMSRQTRRGGVDIEAIKTKADHDIIEERKLNLIAKVAKDFPKYFDDAKDVMLKFFEIAGNQDRTDDYFWTIPGIMLNNFYDHLAQQLLRGEVYPVNLTSVVKDLHDIYPHNIDKSIKRNYAGSYSFAADEQFFSKLYQHIKGLNVMEKSGAMAALKTPDLQMLDHVEKTLYEKLEDAQKISGRLQHSESPFKEHETLNDMARLAVELRHHSSNLQKDAEYLNDQIRMLTSTFLYEPNPSLAHGLIHLSNDLAEEDLLGVEWRKYNPSEYFAERIFALDATSLFQNEKVKTDLSKMVAYAKEVFLDFKDQVRQNYTNLLEQASKLQGKMQTDVVNTIYAYSRVLSLHPNYTDETRPDFPVFVNFVKGKANNPTFNGKIPYAWQSVAKMLNIEYKKVFT